MLWATARTSALSHLRPFILRCLNLPLLCSQPLRHQLGILPSLSSRILHIYPRAAAIRSNPHTHHSTSIKVPFKSLVNDLPQTSGISALALEPTPTTHLKLPPFRIRRHFRKDTTRRPRCRIFHYPLISAFSCS